MRPGEPQRIKVPGVAGFYILIGRRKVQYYWAHRVGKKMVWQNLGPAHGPGRRPYKEAKAMCHGAPGETSVETSKRGSSAYTVSSYFLKVYLPIHKKEYPNSWRIFDGMVRRHLLGLKKNGTKREREPGFEVRDGVALANLRLDSVHHDMIVRLHTWVGETKDLPVAANNLLRRLRLMFAHALRRGEYRGVNPVTNLPNGAEEPITLYDEPERDRFVDEDEMPKLLEAIAAERDEDWRDLFHLLLFTGQRKSTVMAMRWDQIHGDRWLVENNYRRYGTRTKNQENLSVRLLPDALAILDDRRESLKADKEAKLEKSPWVFPAKSGIGGRQKPDGKKGPFIAPRIPGGKEHITDARRAHLRICRHMAKELKRDRMELTIHDLRRTLASWLVAQGAPDVVIADVLGHKSLNSVKRYARLRKGGTTTMEYANAALTAMRSGHDQKRLPANSQEVK